MVRLAALLAIAFTLSACSGWCSSRQPNPFGFPECKSGVQS